MMNNKIKALSVAAILLTATACTSGPVEDKRAPGTPGEKTYEILVNSTWVEVTSDEWDNCGLDEPFPACRTKPGKDQQAR